MTNVHRPVINLPANIIPRFFEKATKNHPKTNGTTKSIKVSFLPILSIEKPAANPEINAPTF